MFKLKAPRPQRSRIREKLKIVDATKYEYVLTTDKDLTEPDKINIVFNEEDLPRIAKLLDAIVKGEDVYVTGVNEHGQKHIESRRIHYFTVEDDEVIAVVGKVHFIIKLKLYEVEEMLKEKYFIRVSKYALVNINKIDYIQPALNSKLLLQMKNGDEVEVNRRYYKAFKKTLQI